MKKENGYELTTTEMQLLTPQQVKLYKLYTSKKRKLWDVYKKKMLAISEEFERNRQSTSLTRQDCQALYNDAKNDICKRLDRDMTQLEDFYYDEKKRLSLK